MSRISKLLAGALFIGMNVAIVQASTLHQYGAEQVNPDGDKLRRHVPQRMPPKVAEPNPAQSLTHTASNEAGVPDIQKINQSGNNVRSTVQNPISSAPAFHYQDEKGNEITEYRELGQPSQIEVRSSMGTRYQLSEPTDPTEMPTRSVRGVPSVTLSY